MKPHGPIVGRKDVLPKLSALLNRRGAAGLLLRGEMGIGKTRLLDECLGQGKRRHMRVERISATETTKDIPLAAMSRLIPPDLEIGPFVGVSALQRCQQELTAPGAPKLLLGVDDIHLLDPASAALIHQLFEADAALLIATIRGDAALPDALTGLWKLGHIDQLEIGPLTKNCVKTLATELLGQGLDSQTTQRLWQLSKGNPLFVRELISSMVASGSLRELGGKWQLTGRPKVPDAIGSVVYERLSALDDMEVEALQLVAFGDPLELDVALAHANEEALESLESKGLIAVETDSTRGPTIRVGHPIHREIVRDRTSKLRSRQIMLTLAQALESKKLHPGDALRIALWQLDSGLGPASELLVQGAREAYDAADQVTAKRLAEAAWIEDPAAESGLILAGIYYHQGEHKKLSRILDELEDLVEDDADVAHLALLRAYREYWYGGNAESAIELIERSIEAIGDKEKAAELDGFRCQIEASSGRANEAITRAYKHLDQGTTRAAVLAGLGASLALTLVGRAAEVREVVRRTKEMIRVNGASTGMYSESLLDVAATEALLAEGALLEAVELADVGYERALSRGDGPGWAFFSLTRGNVNLEIGQNEVAKNCFSEAANLFQLVGHVAPMHWALIGASVAAAHLGQLDEAESYLSRVYQTEHDGNMHDESLWRAKAWIAAQKGDADEAEKFARSGVSLGIGRGQIHPALGCLHDLGRLGYATPDDAELAKELASDMPGLIAPLRAAHVAATAAKDPELLEQVSDDLAAVAMNVPAAEAASLGAEIANQNGDRRTAGRLQSRATALLEVTDVVSGPAIRTSASAVELTRRETDIVKLAIADLSSIQIGEKLLLSPRTVDNHLGRVYAKLGIHSRKQLKEALTKRSVL